MVKRGARDPRELPSRHGRRGRRRPPPHLGARARSVAGACAPVGRLGLVGGQGGCVLRGRAAPGADRALRGCGAAGAVRAMACATQPVAARDRDAVRALRARRLGAGLGALEPGAGRRDRRRPADLRLRPGVRARPRPVQPPRAADEAVAGAAHVRRRRRGSAERGLPRARQRPARPAGGRRNARLPNRLSQRGGGVLRDRAVPGSRAGGRRRPGLAGHGRRASRPRPSARTSSCSRRAGPRCPPSRSGWRCS